MVAFESHARVWQYAPAFEGTPTRELVSSSSLAACPSNEGVEALVALPRGPDGELRFLASPDELWETFVMPHAVTRDSKPPAP